MFGRDLHHHNIPIERTQLIEQGGGLLPVAPERLKAIHGTGGVTCRHELREVGRAPGAGEPHGCEHALPVDRLKP